MHLRTFFVDILTDLVSNLEIILKPHWLAKEEQILVTERNAGALFL